MGNVCCIFDFFEKYQLILISCNLPSVYLLYRFIAAILQDQASYDHILLAYVPSISKKSF